MQAVDALLSAVLNVRDRDLTDIIEFYPHDVEPGADGFDPDLAVARFASVGGITWAGHPYKKQFTGRTEIARSMGPEFNNATVTFDNVTRYMAGFVLATDVEGMRMVVRTISRSLAPSSRVSLVIFTGRVQRPGQINKKLCTINAKQDIAVLNNEVPWRRFQAQCPLEFKGEGCLGGEPLSAKSATYQAAATCDFSHEQCSAYGNTAMFQGFRFFTIQGNYRYYSVESQTRRRLFGLVQSQHQVAVWHDAQWSSSDQTPYGSPVPVALGRVQAEGIPIEFADRGSSVIVRYVLSEGPVDSISSLKNQSGQLSEPIYLPRNIHLGEYGGASMEGEDDQFPPGADKLSRTAFVSVGFLGGSVAAGTTDILPVLTAVLRGLKVPVPDENGAYNQTRWTDNPVDLTRYLLTHPQVFGLSPAMMDDAVNFVSRKVCDEAIIDDSQAERVFIPQDLVGNIGTEAGQHRRYPSTGLINTARFLNELGIDDTPPEFSPPEIEPFDPENPPTDIAPRRYLRKRYTANALLTDPLRAVDFLFKVLLPSFRGYLTVGSNGKIQIRVERPVDNCRVRGASVSGAQSLAVTDVLPWRASTAQLLLIGNGLVTSEVRRVTGARFSAAGNAIPLTAAGSGTVTAAASGATFAGGSDTVQAQGTITLGGAAQAGAQVVATIEGIQAAYTLTAEDTLETAAALLAAHINATPDLRAVVAASYAGAVVTVKSRLGFLDLDGALVYAHDAAEECLRVAGVFDKKNIVDGTFEWPLGQSESPINQVVVAYREASADFAKRELRLNDTPHQRKTGKVERLEINGAAIDNYSQAMRVGEAEFSKRREGDFLCGWQSGPKALPFEEGDVVVVNDDSGGFVNMAVRVEKLRITPTRYVNFTARLYSTLMFSDEVGQHTILLPTVLPLLSQTTPPAATALVLTEGGAYGPDGTWLPRLHGAFTFGPYFADQSALVQVKRPGDAAWVDFARVTPDADGTGAFDIQPAAKGLHWVKVITENSFGLSAGEGHPEASRTIVGTAPAPGEASNLFVSLVGSRVRVFWNAPDVPDLKDYAVLVDGALRGYTDATEYFLEPFTDQAAHTITVRARNRSLLEAQGESVQFTMPAPLAPTGFSLSFDGKRLTGTWSVVEGVTYEYSLDGVAVAWAGSAGQYTELAPVAAGTFNRYLRARRYGIASAWVTQQIVVVPIPNVANFTGTWDGLDAHLTWDEVDDPYKRVVGYQLYDAAFSPIGFSQKPPFDFRPASAVTTLRIKAADSLGNVSPAFTSFTLVIPNPAAPASAAVTFDGTDLVTSWPASTSPGVTYYEVRDGAGQVVAPFVSELFFREKPVYGQADYTRRVYAINRLGLKSLAFAEHTFHMPLPPPPQAAEGAWDGDYIVWTITPPDAIGITGYVVKDTLGDYAGHTGGVEWKEAGAFGEQTYTRRFYSVNFLGLVSTAYAQATFIVPLPDPPSLVAGSFDGRNVVWKLTASAAGAERYYLAADAADLTLQEVYGKEWKERAVFGTINYTRRFYSVNSIGLRSATYYGLTFTVPAPDPPTGFVLSHISLGELLATWSAPASLPDGLEYEYSRDGSNVLARRKDFYFVEAGFALTTRSLTRQVRSVNVVGRQSAWAPANLTIPAPAQPSLWKDTTRANPVSLPVSVTTTTPAAVIRATVLQVRASGAGTWPSTANGTSGTFRFDGAPASVSVPWDAGGAMEFRVAHEDEFTPTLQDHVWSAVQSHTFPKFNDGAIDPASNFLKKAALRNHIVEGGGTIAWTVDFKVKWSADIVITGMPTEVAPSRQITIPANTTGTTLAVGQRLVARHTLGQNNAVPTVVTLSTYTQPDETSNQLDYPLFERRADNTLATYLGVTLDPDRLVNSSVLIPYLTSFLADIKEALIGKANIKDLYAGSIVANALDAMIIFADKIGSRNFVSSTSQVSHTEPVYLRSPRNGSVSADGLTFTKTAGGNDWDTTGGGVTSARAVSHGDCSFKWVIPYAPGTVTTLNLHAAGLSFGDTNGNYTDIDFCVIPNGSGLTSVYEGGTLRGNFSTSWAQGDTLEVAVEAGVVKYYHTPASSGVRALLYTSAVAPRYPLLVDASVLFQGSSLSSASMSLKGVLTPAFGDKLHWQNVVGAAFDSNDDLSKSTAATAWGDSGASSVDTIPAGTDGRVSSLVSASTDNLMLGLSASDADQNYTSLGWAININAAGAFQVYEAGTLKFNGGAGTLATGDEVSVSREGGVIKYRRNGALVYTSAVSSNGAALLVDTAFFTPGSKLKSARLTVVDAIPQGLMLDCPNGRGEVANDFIIGGQRVDRIVAGSYKAVDPYLQFRGNDYGPPQVHKVQGASVYNWQHDFGPGVGVRVGVQLNVTLPGAGKDAYANMDSVRRVKVKALDRFGNIVTDFPAQPFTPGGGMTAMLWHPLRYAHPVDDATYEIRLENYADWSQPFYIVRGVFTTAAPTFWDRNVSPTDFFVNPTGWNRAACAWRPAASSAGTQTLQRRKVGDTSWTNVNAAIAAATDTYNDQEQARGVWYEYRVLNGGASNAASNIMLSTKVWQPGPVQAYDGSGVRLRVTSAAPDGVTVRPVSSTTARLYWDYDTFYTTPTGFRVYRDGSLLATVASPTTGTYDDATAVAGATYSYTVLAYFTPIGADSEMSPAAVITMPGTVNLTDPSNLVGRKISYERNDLSWVLNGNVNAVTLEWKVDDGTYTSGWTTVALPAGTTSYSHTFTSAVISGVKKYAYRVKAGSSNYTNIATVETGQWVPAY
jgi:hypothetical protein